MPAFDDISLNQTYAHLLARVLVRPLIGTRVRPNHLTVLRVLVGLAACVLLGVAGRSAAIWSGALWAVTCLLDRADGEFARLADLRSESGKVLDFYSDMLLDAGWFLGAGIGLRHGALVEIAVPLGILVCCSIVACIWYAELFERLSGPGVKAWRGVERFHPDDALFLLAPLTWLGWTGPVLIASGVCAPVIAIVLMGRYLSLRRRTIAAA